MVSNRKKMLIIDDTPSSLLVISSCLQSMGFDILSAQDGHSGIEIARHELPDLILMDVMMPGMNGFEACRHLKSDPATSDIPIIFMTALTDTEHKIAGFRSGAVDYITKPIQVDEVLVRVQTHLLLRETQKQLQTQYEELQEMQAELELRVAERTAELKEANERLKAEIEERKLAEEKYLLVMEASPVPIAVNDMDGRGVYINPAFTRVFGWSTDEWQSGRIEFIPTECLTETEKIANQLKRGESISGFETRRKSKSGQAVDVIMSCGIWRDRRGEPAGSVAMLYDLTEQKNMMAQYHQAQKMEALGKLVGGVAHDFNNILTVILGVSDILNLQCNPQSQLQKRVEQIQSAAKRASDLVRQLLAFSRQQMLHPQPLNLNEVIINFEKMLRRMIGEDIHLQTAFEPNLELIKADRGQIEQVLMNLVVNARDAMPRGGHLTIETANVQLGESYAKQHLGVVPGTYVMMAVTDTGCGMDAAIINRIFEPFFTTKPQGEGTGLGLSTVHGIVNQSGGHIWVYSEPGHGSCFKVYLPQSTGRTESRDTAKSHPEVKGGNETILVVEDEAIVRKLVRDTLEYFGYTILEADCAAKALAVFSGLTGPVHLLLTDVIIPGGQSGKQLAEHLTALRPGLKVLFMSGYTNDAVFNHGILEPGIAFIQKPFMPAHLAAKVRQVLDSGAGERPDSNTPSR